MLQPRAQCYAQQPSKPHGRVECLVPKGRLRSRLTHPKSYEHSHAHMRHPQKAMVRRIAWVCHAKPNTQGHARIFFRTTCANSWHGARQNAPPSLKFHDVRDLAHSSQYAHTQEPKRQRQPKRWPQALCGAPKRLADLRPKSDQALPQAHRCDEWGRFLPKVAKIQLQKRVVASSNMGCANQPMR